MLKPDLCPKDAKYAGWIKYRYGVTAKQYNTILKRQKSLCALCKSDAPRSKNGRFVVDHCHSSGRIRGLLCLPCNTALGQLGDNAESLLSAISYVSASHGGLMSAARSDITIHVYKRADRPNFFLVAPRHVTGTKIWRNSGTADKDEANRLADLWKAELLVGRLSQELH